MSPSYFRAPVGTSSFTLDVRTGCPHKTFVHLVLFQVSVDNHCSYHECGCYLPQILHAYISR